MLAPGDQSGVLAELGFKEGHTARAARCTSTTRRVTTTADRASSARKARRRRLGVRELVLDTAGREDARRDRVLRDGAANQGQIWEAANMAALWKLPMIFCIENNQYGMGTFDRAVVVNNDYYTMGNIIPGIKMDGMNARSARGHEVRQGLLLVRQRADVREMNTYRYHGHSMSDPGRRIVTATRSTRCARRATRSRT